MRGYQLFLTTVSAKVLTAERAKIQDLCVCVCCEGGWVKSGDTRV